MATTSPTPAPEPTTNFVITLWKAMTGQAVLKWVSIVAIIFLAITFAKSCSVEKQAALYSDSLTVWKAETKTILTQNAAINKKSDSLMKIISVKGLQSDSLSRLIVRLHQQQNVQRVKDDSTLTVLSSTLPDTCQAALELAKQYRLDADSSVLKIQDLFTQKDSISQIRIGLLTTDVFNLQHSNDSLVSQLKVVPEYKPPKFLHFFPLPSRKATFLTGLVLGGGTIAVIAWHK